MFTANIYTPLGLDREMVLLQLAAVKLYGILYSIKLEFYSQKRQIRFSSHPFGELGVTYALHL